MEYLIGVLLSLSVLGTACAVGFDRERVFFPMMMIVIATYYVLFAAMGAPLHIVVVEALIAGLFILVSVISFRINLWFAVAGLGVHGIFDFVHHLFIFNPGVPLWWPGFCLAFDFIAGSILAFLLVRRIRFPL